MRVLDRLPFAEGERVLNVSGKSIRIKSYQIIVWVSLSTTEIAEWDPRTPRFPALLDTGHNFNFSIQEDHLRRWAGLAPESLRLLRESRENRKPIRFRDADIWIHGNRPGTDTLRDAPYRLTVEEGVGIHPDDGSSFPRLPLLGLRGLVRHQLKLVIDGKTREVTLRSTGWR